MPNDTLKELLTVLLPIATALIGYELGLYKESHDRRRQQDKDTYARLSELLTKHGLMTYLRDHDFGAAYRSQIHEEMDELYYFTQDPRNRFLDKQLKQMTEALASSIDDFNHRLAHETTQPNPDHPDISRIAQAYHEMPPYDHYTRAEYETLRADLNQKVENIWKQYSDLVAAAKRKL